MPPPPNTLCSDKKATECSFLHLYAEIFGGDVGGAVAPLPQRRTVPDERVKLITSINTKNPQISQQYKCCKCHGSSRCVHEHFTSEWEPTEEVLSGTRQQRVELLQFSRLSRWHTVTGWWNSSWRIRVTYLHLWNWSKLTISRTIIINCFKNVDKFYEPNYYQFDNTRNVGQCPMWWPPCRI